MFESRLSTGRNLSRSVNICGARGWSAEEGVPPFLCIIYVEACLRLRFGILLRRTWWGSTPNLLAEIVQMVADEVFSPLPNNGKPQGIPLLRVRLTNTRMFSDRVSISGIRFAPQRTLR